MNTDLKWSAEVINLNGTAKIRLSRGPFLEGYYNTMAEMERHLTMYEVDLSEITIEGSQSC